MKQDADPIVAPLAGSSWSRPETIARFTASPPNATLMQVAQAELRRIGTGRVVDLGCGAGRNAIPLAAAGWNVLGVDLSFPMINAAFDRARQAHLRGRLRVVLAPMDAVPVASRSGDLVIAHGIWNLARSGAEFRAAVREAARVARQGGALFVFTFSRNTLPREVKPVPGESFVFTQFSGDPQCFLTENELRYELAEASFVPDPSVPLRELNRPADGELRTRSAPVIYEGMFRYCG
jgi:SAM-dependent methyltransferase